MTKYEKIYNNLINRAQRRTLVGEYTEKHHIIPRSLGGVDTNCNIVKLTAREHFVCHWLLVKMTTGDEKRKMIYALMCMRASNGGQSRYESGITSRVYETYRKQHAENHSSVMKGKVPVNKGTKIEGKALENIRTGIENRVVNQETQAAGQIKRIEKIKGTHRSESTKKKISKALKGKAKPPMAPGVKDAISKKLTGTAKADGHAENVASAVRGNISINKEGKEMKVKEHQLDEYISAGWLRGGRKRKRPLSFQ